MANREEILHQLKLELCRREFYEYCKFIDPGFFTPGKKHLELIAGKFQLIADGKIKKLSVSLPPRAGKSYITSLFCSWLIGRNTKDALEGKDKFRSIMRNCYAAKLAEKFSRDIRDGMISHPKVKEVFPWLNLGKLTAIDGWSIEGNTQPSYFCAGVGGAITGFGCTLVAILDDPIKNIEDALSPTIIEKTWDWYTSTHLSRLETGCPEIHIATRWSKNDPIGHLTDPESDAYLPDMDVVCIAALDKNGNSFCEEIKTTEEYHTIRKITDEIIWEAEFMQQPVDIKGQLFPKEELNFFSKQELEGIEIDGILSYIDVADKGKDYLSAPLGKISSGKVYITDVVFTQDEVKISTPLVVGMLHRNNTDQVIVETNNMGEYFKRDLQEELIKVGSTCSVGGETANQNKETRILLRSGYIKENFYFRNDYEPGSMYDKFMRQLTSYVKFGNNVNDDAPDSLTGLSKWVENIQPKAKVKKKKQLPFALQDDTPNIGGYVNW